MAKASRKPSRHPIALVPDDYPRRSQQPLQALIFLAPLLVMYELGALIYATDYARGVTLHVKARLMLLGFFEWFGLSGFLLPGLIVMGALLGWHLVRKDPWRVEPKTYAGMALESILAAVPLFVFALVMAPRPAMAMRVQGLLSDPPPMLAGATPLGTPWQAEVIFSVGAGIYEELLFRLLLIAALHALFVDGLALPDVWGSLLAMVLSSLAFALYHFAPGNPFSWSLLGFYTTAGFYLACLYVLRGIGIAAGTHAAYDLFVVAWHLLR